MYKQQGQTHAYMPRSPHAHAAIRAIDTAQAKAMPGVLAIVTGADQAGAVPYTHLTLPTNREVENSVGGSCGNKNKIVSKDIQTQSNGAGT